MRTGEDVVQAVRHAAGGAHGALAAARAGAVATHGAAVSSVAQASVGGLLFQMVVALGVVLGLLWLLARLAQSRRVRARLRRSVGSATPSTWLRAHRVRRARVPRGTIHLEDRQLLGKGIALVVVSVGSKRLLLALTQQRVELLAELDGDGPEGPAEEEGRPGVGDSGSAADDAGGDPLDLRFLLEDPEPPSGVPAWARPPGGSLVERLRELTVRRS